MLRVLDAQSSPRLVSEDLAKPMLTYFWLYQRLCRLYCVFVYLLMY
jgi:hypothetical protein